MPDYQLEDCYDIEELAKHGITVRFTVNSGVEFVYADTELNQSVILARLDDINRGCIKFSTSFMFNKDFETLLHDKFEILPIFKREKFWAYSVDFKQSTLVYVDDLCLNSSTLTLDEFRKEFNERLKQSLSVYLKKKEILKRKYNQYRKHVMGNTANRKFLFYLKLDPEMTRLPNGNEIRIIPIHEYWFVVKVMVPVLVGVDLAGDIYDTENVYYIIYQDFNKFGFSSQIFGGFNQAQFNIIKSIG